jgi:hypothetical protein
MGLLDDAIREHLELKRRHGADPSEVERQEHEALGPARRSAAPATETAYAEDDLPAGAIDDEDDPDALYDDDELEFDDEPVAAASPAGPEAPVAPADDRDRHERFEREPADDAAEVVDDFEPVDDDDLEPPPPADRVAGEEKGEDVLEETPEFLQETPEHDRLWFEQKPPRDFDFDR